jgi:hypothetical protein
MAYVLRSGALVLAVAACSGAIEPAPSASPDAGSPEPVPVEAGAPEAGAPDAEGVDASPDRAPPPPPPDAGGDAGAHVVPYAADPAVFTAASVPAFVGKAPSALVAFAYRAGAWAQIPVQVDERVTVDLGKIYNQAATGATVLVYADPTTYVGADTDPNLDADDEIALMIADAGAKAAAGSAPKGVVAKSGVEVAIGALGYVYLFEQDGSLDPSAGQKYVTYAFGAASATVTTTAYAQHFVGRWITDELHLRAGTGVDVLDQNKIFFAPGGGCGENEQTFNGAEGEFVANKDGAVRAIRSYVGAASGPYTQRDHVFYRAREDVRTYLRVHPIPSIVDAMSYSTDAVGMTYSNDAFTAGDVIDGVAPASAPPAASLWELVTGAQGSLAFSYAVDTDIPNLTKTLYYEDNKADNQCTPQSQTYGLSGPYISSPLPCTDPTINCTPPAAHLAATRTAYFGPPGWSNADAAALDASAKAPPKLVFAAAP